MVENGARARLQVLIGKKAVLKSTFTGGRHRTTTCSQQNGDSEEHGCGPRLFPFWEILGLFM